MWEAGTEETDILRVALDTETDGLEMYKAAAENASNPVARKMFSGLVEDEKSHIKMIEQVANDMGLDEALKNARENTPAQRMKTIFTEAKDEFAREEAPTADEFEALEKAMEFEKKGHEFYKEGAEKAQSEDRKKLCEKLAFEEGQHYQILESTLEYVKDTNEWTLWEGGGLLTGDMYAGE